MKLLGSYDYYENSDSNLAVVLMCDYQNNLIAYTNKLSRLPILREYDEPIFLDFGGGEGFYFSELDENLLAKDGQKISFDIAAYFFPYLKDSNFWREEKWNGYYNKNFIELGL